MRAAKHPATPWHIDEEREDEEDEGWHAATRWTLRHLPLVILSSDFLGSSIAATGELIDTFLEWFPAHGGTVGKPPH